MIKLLQVKFFDILAYIPFSVNLMISGDHACLVGMKKDNKQIGFQNSGEPIGFSGRILVNGKSKTDCRL